MNMGCYIAVRDIAHSVPMAWRGTHYYLSLGEVVHRFVSLFRHSPSLSSSLALSFSLCIGVQNLSFPRPSYYLSSSSSSSPIDIR